jgi:U4/U6.U5 tri-snRNP-associated protein 1
MAEGEARILTLKDSRILDNDGGRFYDYSRHLSLTHFAEDELQNVEMAEEDRRQKNEDLKKKRPDYKGYDDDEFAEGSAGMKRAVLAKYDEDMDGSRETVSPTSHYLYSD